MGNMESTACLCNGDEENPKPNLLDDNIESCTDEIIAYQSSLQKYLSHQKQQIHNDEQNINGEACSRRTKASTESITSLSVSNPNCVESPQGSESSQKCSECENDTGKGLVSTSDDNIQAARGSHYDTTFIEMGSVVSTEKTTKKSPSFRSLKRRSKCLLINASVSISNLLALLEEFLFPRTKQLDGPTQSSTDSLFRGGVLLHRCNTPEEHYSCIRDILNSVKDRTSVHGLSVIGLDYRIVPCEMHRRPNKETDEALVGSPPSATGLFSDYCNNETTSALIDETLLPIGDTRGHRSRDFDSVAANNGTIIMSRVSSGLDLASCISNADNDEDTSISEHSYNIPGVGDPIEEMPIAVSDFTNPEFAMCRCHSCMRRMYHVETQTIIDEMNRTKYIADGDMYEAVSRLAQEYAFDIMIGEGDLKWVSVENVETDGREPIRALINSDHPLLLSPEERQNSQLKDQPTLLICTGRGKVRAGIFSRQHLICNGMEGSTCIPFIREAQARNLNVFIVDPNVHGDSNGFITFQKTLNYWCNLRNQAGMNDEYGCLRTYILSHSASGGHLVRYLLDQQPKKEFLPYIKAIAFTDSTHNVQWAKAPEHRSLFTLLQSDTCVYFRCGKLKRDTAIDNQWYLHPAGEPVATDTFWQHRFGTIKTMWAGTDEHSLTNWYSFTKIWEHFDNIMVDHSKR